MRPALAAVLLAAFLALPGFARASSLFVLDVGNLPPDQQMTLTTLQGIVNRAGPTLYLEGLTSGQDMIVDDTAQFWLETAVPLANAQLPQCSLAAGGTCQVISMFRAQVNGLVVWDPNLEYDTQNVATTLAGLNNLLPVSPDVAAVLSAPPDNIPIAIDLRQQQFSSGSAAYQWALTNLTPLSQFQCLAWMGAPRNTRPIQPGLRDLLVSKRCFVFDGNPNTEAVMVTQILNSFPPLIPVFGYPFFDDPIYATTGEATGEPQGVGEISRSGKWLIPSLDGTNLTVHSWLKPDQPTPVPPWDDSAATADPNTTYVAFAITDGDNLGQNEHFLMTKHWQSPDRGLLPMGVSISLWLQVYAPRIWDYYVRTESANDVLIAGPSGAGYAYPSSMPNLPDYLSLTKSLLGSSGMRSVWILDNGYIYSPSFTTTDQYVQALNPSILFTDYGGWVLPNPPALSYDGNVPIVHAMWGNDVTSTVDRIEGLAATSPHPAFIFVALETATMGYPEALQIQQQLASSPVGPIQIVRPDRFAGMLRAAAPALP